MYSQIETKAMAFLANGSEIRPVATLKDESGGVAHIWVDDHCYQLGIERSDLRENDPQPANIPWVCPVTHIFGEAFDVLVALPRPA